MVSKNALEFEDEISQGKGIHPPSNEEIANLAYHIWSERGQTPNSSEENWLTAEAQLAVGRTFRRE